MKLKEKLLAKYQSNFMKYLVQTSPIFNDITMPIYQKTIQPLDEFEERLIEGRMAEIDFYESNLCKRFFTYKGDKSIYSITNDKYTDIDFNSVYNVGIDVKIVSIKKILFSDHFLHYECMIRQKDIEKYVQQVCFPFILAYCDYNFAFQRNRLFIDINTVIKNMNKYPLVDIFKRKDTFYRINIDYNNQPIKYLYTCQEFEQLMETISIIYGDYVNKVGMTLYDNYQ